MKTVEVRLLSVVLALLAIVLTAFGALAYLLARQNMQADIDQFAVDKALILARRANPHNLSNILFFDRDWWSRRYTPHGQTFDTNWQPMFVSYRLPGPILPTEKIKRAASHPSGIALDDVTGADGERYRAATVPKDHDGQIVGYAQISVPLTERDRDLRRLLLWLVLGGVVTLGAAGLAISYLLRQWRAPLNGLVTTARQVSVSNLGRQRLFAPPESPELAQLAHAFNELLDKLEAAQATQQQFVADASHELRTPLTILRGEIEVALRKPRSADDYRQVLQSSREEIDRLSRLADNLLVLARVDAGEMIQKREVIDLGELCRTVCARLKPLAALRGVSLITQSSNSTSVSGDHVALDRVVANLVENALHHTASGETVRVLVSANGRDARVQVSDSGPGIPDEHLPHIFERFYRVDHARSREFGGAGLGLAIVNAFVQAHGGRVEVRSEVGQGSTFTVVLPQTD